MLEFFKAYKRTFPEEPNRTGYLESFITVHPELCSLFLHTVLLIQFPSLIKHNKLRYAVENVIFFVPFSFICFEEIVPNKYYVYCILAYDFLVVSLLIIKLHSLRKTPPSPVLPSSTSDSTRPEPTVQRQGGNTVRLFRGIVYIATVTCILGRDLNGFRVIFSKAYFRGTGLMDVGVGFFLFLMGMTGPTSRTKPKDFTREKQKAAIKVSLKWVVILLTIGFIKIVVERRIDHLPNPTEYGETWNVFITLGVLKFVGTVVEILLCHRCPPVFLAIVISSAMEVLQAKGLKFYVFYAERTNFFSSNREGIVQCVGLLALYLWGLQMGKLFFNTLSLPSSQCCQSSRFLKLSPNLRFFFILLVPLVFCMSFSFVLKWKNVIEVESRCLANFAYVLWIVAFCITLLIISHFASWAASLVQQKIPNAVDMSSTGHVIFHIDRNGFVFFIIGNLLTGLYSHSFLSAWSLRDIFKERSAWLSLLILSGYCSLTAFLAIQFPLLLRCLRRVRIFTTKK